MKLSQELIENIVSFLPFLPFLSFLPFLPNKEKHNIAICNKYQYSIIAPIIIYSYNEYIKNNNNEMLKDIIQVLTFNGD
jgi:hypothetical protein